MIQAKLSSVLNYGMTNAYHLVISTNKVRRNLIAQQSRFLADARNDRIIYSSTSLLKALMIQAKLDAELRNDFLLNA
jgi:hypothetical protein